MSLKAFRDAAARARESLDAIGPELYDDNDALRADYPAFFIDDVEHITSPTTDLNTFTGVLAFLASTDALVLLQERNRRALEVLYLQIARPFPSLYPRWAPIEIALERYPGYRRTLELGERARQLIVGPLADLLGKPEPVTPAPFPRAAPSMRYGQMNQLAVDRHFGRHVEVGDRVLEVCSYSLNEVFIPGSAEVFWNAVHSQPAMVEAFLAVGIDVGAVIRAYDRLPTVPLRTESGMALTLDNCIGFVGKRFHQVYPLTDTHRRIRTSGILRVSDLVLGSLEHGIQPSTRTYASLVQRLCRVAGTEVEKPPSERVDRFRTQLAGKLEAAFNYLGILDPSMERQQFVLYDAGGDLVLQPFAVFGGYELPERAARSESVWLARGNVIQPSRHFSDEQLAALADLIRKNAPEADFQRFFEDHPQFLLALGSDYVSVHPQLVLEEDGGSRLIPDFFLERLDSHMADILDLKLPTHALKRLQRHRNRFRDAVMEGVAQLTHYRNWFESRANRELFRTKYDLGVYRPRVVLVIGRRYDYYSDVERLRAEAMLPEWLSLRTYDDIIDAARAYRKLFG